MSLITQQATAIRSMEAMPFANEDEYEDWQLRQRIQALAQELQDLIFDFTTAVETDQVITIEETYRPPKGLRINSKTRKIGARLYYSTNAFLCNVGDNYGHGADVRFWWLKNLPQEHRAMTQTIRTPSYDRKKTTVIRWVDEGHHIALERLGTTWTHCCLIQGYLDTSIERIARQGIVLSADCLKADWKKKESEELKWFSIKELVKIKDDLYEEHLRGD